MADLQLANAFPATRCTWLKRSVSFCPDLQYSLVLDPLHGMLNPLAVMRVAVQGSKLQFELFLNSA